jgi:autotransporter-associated beta strand protein
LPEKNGERGPLSFAARFTLVNPTSMKTTRLALLPRLLLVAAASQASVQAQSLTIIDGDVPLSERMFFEGSHALGSADGETVYTNFFTEGGAGSGGGAGFGGVFFVNSGATLTLTNVSFKSNTVKGGEGGSTAPVAIGGYTLAALARSADISALPNVGTKPIVTQVDGDYVVTGVILPQASPLLAVGNAVNFSTGLNASTIAEIDDTDVTFADPVTISADAVTSVGAVAAAGATTLSVSPLLGFTQSDFKPGDSVVGAGIPEGAVISEVIVNADNEVTGIKIDAATTGAVVGFAVVDASQFDAAQFAFGDTQDTLIINAAGRGLVKDMLLSGDGIPEGTVITSIEGDVVTLSNPIDATSFRAELPVGEVGGNTLRLSGATTRLQAGMSVAGDGIPAGTVIQEVRADGVLVLSNALTEVPREFTASSISSRDGAVLTLLSTEGLEAGMTVSGDGFSGTIVSVSDNTVTLSEAPGDEVVSLLASSSLSKGGSLNGITPTGTRGFNGRDGVDARSDGAFLNEGEGQEGTNGYNAGEGTGSFGGDGGDGGNGSDGQSFNYQLTKEVIDGTFDVVDQSRDLVADFSDLNFASAALKVANIVLAAINLGEASANLAIWNNDLSRGLVGLGGAGGDGGEGGEGDEFFGGGAGGNGGNGGNGALSDISDGGPGGEGGRGGFGGFGAGGGAGGAGGSAGSTGQGVDGDPGDGGRAGFGAGEGSNGDGEFGGGGSGYGGAIFVRKGGSLTITGNSVFENNAVLGGSSNNGGEAGQAAGTDIFLMKGGELYLAPGAGKVIRLEGTIADDSTASIEGGSFASGAGATVRFGGGGLVQLVGENTYTGVTLVEGAAIEAEDGVNIHSDSRIQFAGAGVLDLDSEAGLAQGLNTGSIVTSGEIVRRVGNTLPNQVTWSGAGGFSAATEEGLILNFGAINSTTGQTLRWNAAGITDDSVIVFGSELSQGTVTLVNAFDLNGSTGRFAVFGNSGELAPEQAVMSGALSNGSIEVGSAGYEGALFLTGQSSLTNVTVNSGVLSTQGGGRLFAPGVGGNLTVRDGDVQLWAGERLLSASVAAGASLTSVGSVVADEIDNLGTMTLASASFAYAVTNRSGATLNILGDLTVEADGLGARGGLSNQAGGVLNQSADIDAVTVTNDGTWNVRGAVGADTRVLATAEGLFGSGSLVLATTSFTDEDTGETAEVTATLDLEVGADGEGSFGGVISGPGSLVKSGAGSQVLAGDNTFTGDLTAAAGTLVLTGTQDDAVDVIVRSGATLVFGRADKLNTVTVDAGGSADVEQDLETAGDFTTNGTTVIVGDRTLTLGGGLAGSGLVSVAGDGQSLVVDQAGDSTYSGSIAGLGRFTKTGAGTLTLAGAAGSLDLGGGVVVDGGILALDGAGILDADLDLTINLGGTLELVSGTQVANSIGGLGTIDLGEGNTLEVNDGGDFEGTVTGSGILRVAGGELNVTNITSDSGTFDVGNGATTTITDGGTLTFPDLVVQAGSTLHFGAAGSDPGASNVNVSGSADIYGNVTGTGTLTGNTTTHAGANIAPGNSPGILTFAGNLTVSALTNFDMELEGFAGAGVDPGGHDQVQVGGDLVLNGGSLTIQQLSGFELGRGQSLRIFAFGAGKVSGQFDTATSELTNPVFYSLATGNVTGYGAGGRTALLAAIAPNPNQAAMLSSTLVETSGGVDQVYGGRLLDELAAAVQANQSTDRVFELSTAERHGGLLAQARGTLLGAMAELPAESAVPADGWSLTFSGGSLDSAEEGERHLGYKVSRNSATVLRTTPQPLGALTLGLSLDEGKVSGVGYRADNVGMTLGVGFQRKLESVPGLALGLRAGLSRQIADTSRETLGATSTAEDVDTESSVVGAGIGYARAFGALNLTASLEALVYRSSVDSFRENNVSSLDALEVDEQEDNGTAVVAVLGLSGKVSEKFTLGGDLRVTSFSGSEYHNVTSSVLTEEVDTTVTHQANGQNILGLGLFGAYRIDEKSSIRLGGRAEGDGGLSDGYRFDLSYRRDF